MPSAASPHANSPDFPTCSNIEYETQLEFAEQTSCIWLHRYCHLQHTSSTSLRQPHVRATLCIGVMNVPGHFFQFFLLFLPFPRPPCMRDVALCMNVRLSIRLTESLVRETANLNPI